MFDKCPLYRKLTWHVAITKDLLHELITGNITTLSGDVTYDVDNKMTEVLCNKFYTFKSKI